MIGCVCTAPLKSPDPRYQASCQRCAKLFQGPQAVRDREWERQFLTYAGGAQYAADVLDRVDRLDAVHGSRWTTYSLERMLSEIDEEGADLGGWPMLTAQHPELLDLDDDRLQWARLLLTEIARHGAEVRALTGQLRSLLD
ncbi:MAG: hypothetical protein H0U59_09080 [Gemmatimonadaceae bacterium]|nr:hypothetical protein [Gemmatimonadaceae bacterium]